MIVEIAVCFEFPEIVCSGLADKIRPFIDPSKDSVDI